MEYPFLLRRSNGKIWRAGSDIWGLCSAWNHATNPGLPLSERESIKSLRYARAITNRMKRLNAVYKIHYIELSNGSLWPIKNIGAQPV